MFPHTIGWLLFQDEVGKVLTVFRNESPDLVIGWIGPGNIYSRIKSTSMWIRECLRVPTCRHRYLPVGVGTYLWSGYLPVGVGTYLWV